MIHRNGLTIALIRASNDTPYPDDKLINFPERNMLSSRAVVVTEGGIFYIRITVTRNFAWYDANALEVLVNYDFARSWSRGQYFMFPRIQKPETPEEIVVNLSECPVKQHGTSTYKGLSTKFIFTKVLCRTLALISAILMLTASSGTLIISNPYIDSMKSRE